MPVAVCFTQTAIEAEEDTPTPAPRCSVCLMLLRRTSEARITRVNAWSGCRTPNRRRRRHERLVSTGRELARDTQSAEREKRAADTHHQSALSTPSLLRIRSITSPLTMNK